MSITNSQQLSIQITDCPRTEAVAPFFRMEGTEWWRANTPLILLCETLERENAALKVQVRELIATMEEEGEMDAVRTAELKKENATLRADNQAAHALVLDLRTKEHSERTLAVKLERENAALRELVSTLGAPSHVNVPWEKWRKMRDENAELRAKVAAQGLSLACLADGILGEDAADRSDQALVRTGCRLAGEVAALRADKERLDWMQHGGNAVDDVLYDMNVVVDFDVRAAIDAARKEQP